MKTQNPSVEVLSRSLVDELVTSVGLRKNHLNHAIFWVLFRFITDKLAVLGVPFDQLVAEQGLPSASQWMLTHFCDQVSANGVEHIPQEGPLLVAANHPGAYDALVCFSQMGRKDIKWVSSDIPFLKLLPFTSEHIFFSSRQDQNNRMLVMRNAVQHLKQGGALLFFAAGHREPDPAVYLGSDHSISQWMNVFDPFFKYVDGLQLLPAISSGMVSSRWARHPLTWLRRKQIDKQRLAEFGQVITQLLKPGKWMMQPAVSFGEVFGEGELRKKAGEGSLFPAVVDACTHLLKEHVSQFGGKTNA